MIFLKGDERLRALTVILAVIVMSMPGLFGNPVSAKKSAIKALTSKSNYLDAHVKAGGKWILIDLGFSEEKSQYFVAYKGDKPVYRGLASGAITNIFVSSNSHPDKPHNHTGVFWVKAREKSHRSRLYSVTMNHCLFYLNGHALHACQKKDIGKLGSPASHGCTRVSPEMAKKLFSWAGKEKVAVIIVK